LSVKNQKNPFLADLGNTCVEKAFGIKWCKRIL